jgi:hypothetical protein
MRKRQRSKSELVVLTTFALLLILLPGLINAGDLEPTSPPTNGTMHSLEEIYQEIILLKNKLNDLTILVNGSGRFVDLRNGTVKDNQTGLIWLKMADCLGAETWQDAKNIAAALADGQCMLTDGSVAGNWRLPTQAEWGIFTDQSYNDPALSNAIGNAQWSEGDVFTGVKSAWYWSSTTDQTYPEDANLWYSVDGYVNWHIEKTSLHEIWPVRGGN